jgi:high-affinity iron transporter
MTMRKRFTPPALAASLAAIVLIAGCGDGDSSSSTEKEEHEAAATPQKAIAEIALVRAGLAAGLAAYEEGDAKKADELIGDAYLEHFEVVEGPLEESDEELNEELELLISTEIRQEIKRGENPAEVAALVEEANEQLDQAEKALKG